MLTKCSMRTGNFHNCESIRRKAAPYQAEYTRKIPDLAQMSQRFIPGFTVFSAFFDVNQGDFFGKSKRMMASPAAVLRLTGRNA